MGRGRRGQRDGRRARIGRRETVGSTLLILLAATALIVAAGVIALGRRLDAAARTAFAGLDRRRAVPWPRPDANGPAVR